MTLFAKWQIHQKVEILMNYDLMGLSGVAAIQWETISSHQVLTEERTRVALATFLYARTLVNHEETRNELFHRVGNAGQKLESGETEFLIEPWSIEKDGIAFPLWPWNVTSPVNIRKAKIYKASLESRPKRGTRGNLKMALGQEAILAPLLH